MVKRASSLASKIEANWYQSALGNLWLLPLWVLFTLISYGRRFANYLFPAKEMQTPVLVVGNISVGGTGKTPLITYLVERAEALGISTAVISRGYGGQADAYPLTVTPDTQVHQCGDEPKLLTRLGCPIVVDPKRSRAACRLNGQVNLIISDDGLQHYALSRQAEIVVSDVSRGFGNGWLLPIGPLRESQSRLKTVDLWLENGSDFRIQPQALIDGNTGKQLPLDYFNGVRINAVAGIGNPARFFNTMKELGCQLVEYPFPDHHEFTDQDLLFAEDVPIVMTEKDWVKCTELNLTRVFYLRVAAVPTPETETRIEQLLLNIGKKNG